jgi:hypothetical protein
MVEDEVHFKDEFGFDRMRGETQRNPKIKTNTLTKAAQNTKAEESSESINNMRDLDFKEHFNRCTDVFRKSIKSARLRIVFGFLKESNAKGSETTPISGELAEDNLADSNGAKSEEVSSKKKPKNRTFSSKEVKVLNVRVQKWMKMLEDYPERVHFKLKRERGREFQTLIDPQPGKCSLEQCRQRQKTRVFGTKN